MKLAVPSHLPYPLWKRGNPTGHQFQSLHGSALARLGQTLTGEGCHAEAIEAFSQALSLKPNSRSIREWRAACYLQLGDYEKALADMEDVVTIDPSYASGYNNRGLCFLLKGRIGKALEDLSKAIELDPKHVRAYANKAVIYCALGRYYQAERACKAGLMLDAADEELLCVQRKIQESSRN